MKKDIHPQVHPVVFVDSSTGEEFVSTSTVTSEETKKIDGVDHYVIKLEVTSKCHPFFTGKKQFIQRGRIDAFKAKMAKAEEHKTKNDA